MLQGDLSHGLARQKVVQQQVSDGLLKLLQGFIDAAGKIVPGLDLYGPGLSIGLLSVLPVCSAADHVDGFLRCHSMEPAA